MRLRELEQILEKVKPFSKPKLILEQYATDAHIAALMIFTAATTFQDIKGKKILDLGCGCGMLSIASIIMEAHFVIGFDIDYDALEQCRENMMNLEIKEFHGGSIMDEYDDKEGSIRLVQADVSGLSKKDLEGIEFDTIVMNPPFGTKSNEGIDIAFLKSAASLLSKPESIIYSMHKSSTRDYIQRKARESLGLESQVLAQMKFELKHQFKFHRKERVWIDVDLIRFTRSNEKK